MINEPIENYVPLGIQARFRRQAFRVWLLSTAVILIWVALIVLAPLAKASGFFAVSSPLYNFFSYICHQISERSFHVEGEKFAVCSRCFGVYFGLLAGFVGYPLWREIDSIEPPPRFWLFLSLIPISVDWALGVFGIWENTHLSRFVTGSILGVACAVFIVPALVEITRNLAFRRGAKKAAERQPS
jgi:uncharacterized membrane protein